MSKSIRSLLRRSKVTVNYAWRRLKRGIISGPTRVRQLTPGEVALARLVFAEAIDYRRVRILNRCYLPFGLQPRNCAMSPNGRIYFHPSRFEDDFSGRSHRLQHWFLHEMTHVWQHQLGYPVRTRGALRLGLSYVYRLAPGRRLRDYNMEAQGNLLADWFALKFLEDADAMAQPQHAAHLALYEQVLGDFFLDRNSQKNLPKLF
jgi:hypothetical protein